MRTFLEVIFFRTLCELFARAKSPLLFVFCLIQFSYSLAQVETDFSNGGAIRVGDSSTACAPAIEGAIRFDADGADTLDYCDGANWMTLLTSAVGGAIVNNGNSFAAPMVIGTNDLNTLAFETNNVVRMTFNTSGDVGIGTATPPEKLSVHNGNVKITRAINDSNPASLILYKTRSGSPPLNDTTYGEIKFNYLDAGPVERTAASILAEVDGTPGNSDIPSRLVFNTALDGTNFTAERMRITNEGRVGIGTNSPASKLDVYSDFRVSENSNYYIGMSAGGSGNTNIEMRRGTTSKTNEIRLYDNTTLKWGLGQIDTSGVAGATGDEFYIGQTSGGSNSALVIKSNNFVGIGTLDPAVELDVNAGTINAAAICDESNSNCKDISSGWNATVAADSLNWTDFSDTMTLDATTTIDMDTNSADLNFDSNTLMIDSSANRVGFGTGTPLAKMHLSEDGNSVAANLYNGSETFMSTSNTGNSFRIIAGAGNYPSFAMLSQRGTTSAPSTTSSGDLLGNLVFQGYGGGTRLSGASITAAADGGVGANDMPGRLMFNTTPDGSSTLVEAMRIDRDGKVGVGTNNPSALLHVNKVTDTTSNQVARFDGNNRATAADNDLAYFSYHLDDETGSSTEYARMNWKAQDVTDATEDGEISFSVLSNGTMYEALTLKTGSNDGATYKNTNMNLIGSGNGNNGVEISATNSNIGFQASHAAITAKTPNITTRLVAIDSNSNITNVSEDAAAVGTETNQKFHIFTNNIGRVAVDTAGRVGIGTSSPAVELDVETGTINAAAICDENNANCLDLSTGIGGTPNLIEDADQDTRIRVEAAADQDRIRFDAAGSEALTIWPTDFPSADIGAGVRMLPAGAPGSNITELHIKNGSSGSGGNYLVFGAAWGVTDYANIGTVGGDSLHSHSLRLWTGGDRDIFFSPNGTERMRLTASNGFFGIGTNAPAVELDVNTGTINAAAICDENNANCLDLSAGVSGGDPSYGSSASSPNDAIYIDDNGWAGMGTVTPSANFHMWSESDPALRIESNPYDATSDFDASYFYTFYNSSTTNTGDLTGIRNEVAVDGSRSNNDVYATYNLIGINNSGGNDDVAASFSHVAYQSGTTTSLTGSKILYEQSGGSVTTGAGLYIDVDSSGGTTTNMYGLYIDTLAGTNRWGVFQNGSSDLNYFAGKIGIGTTAPTQTLTIGNGTSVDGGIVAKGFGTVGTNGTTLTETGAGRRMIWYPRKGAFRAGGVDDDTWDDANIGNYSSGFGFNAKATGIGSIASSNSHAAGDYSVALGTWNYTDYTAGVAMGHNATSYGEGTIAIGSWVSSQSSHRGVVIGTSAEVGSGYGYNNDGVNSIVLSAGNSVGTLPVVTGDDTVGIFLGDNSGVNITADNVMAVMGGNVGIGTAAPSHILHINGQGRSTNSSWATTSDRRLKDVQSRYQYGLDEILKLSTYWFRYKKDNPLSLPSDQEFMGVMAQDLMKIIPEAVEMGQDGFYTVNTDPLFWALVNAVQDISNKCENDLPRIEALEEENKQLKAELKSIRELLEKHGIR